MPVLARRHVHDRPPVEVRAACSPEIGRAAAGVRRHWVSVGVEMWLSGGEVGFVFNTPREPNTVIIFSLFSL